MKGLSKNVRFFKCFLIKKIQYLKYVERSNLFITVSCFSFKKHDVQKGDVKEIEVALIVLTPSKYVAARRDAPKRKKIQKNFNLNIKMIKI